MNAQVGYNDDRKQRTESERHYERDSKDQRKDHRQSLNLPYILQSDGVNPPRIVFVSPAGSDRSSGRSRANSVRTPDHGDHRGPLSSKWRKKDLEDAIQFALSKIEIRPSTGDYEDGYENDYRDYDDSKHPSGKYHPSTSRATQSRGHDAATSREPDRPEPGVSYHYGHQDPRSASEQTLHGFSMDYPEYTDVSVQTDAPGNERRDTEPDSKPKRHYSQRRSHVPPSRPSVSRVPSADYYVVEDTKARVADEPRSKGARDSYVYYQGPYRVLVTPNDEDEYRNKRSSKYNAYVRRQDEDDRRHEHESQRRHRSSRSRHSRAEHAYDEGHKERREDRDRDRQSSHREGDGTRRWPFPFTKDRRSEYR